MGLLHEHIILPLSDLMRGEQVYHHLKEIRRAAHWTAQQMDAFQQGRLQSLLEHAAASVPFYQEWFQQHNLDPHTASLGQMPIVCKSLMRQEGINRFTSQHFPQNERIASSSSGSTGEPFSFYTTKLADSVNTAAKLHTWQLSGYRLGDRYMKIANSIRHGKWKRLQDRVNNCIHVPFYSIDDQTLCTILDLVERCHPKYIRAYPLPLYLMAQYRNTHPEYTFHPTRIFTTGATLTDTYRKEIEQAFGCDIIDSYSCEGTPNTYQTPEHNGYTTCGYYGIIEVLDNEGQRVTDGIGRVVSTDLWNLAHPFIRYDTQDLVEIHNNHITKIIGRQSDILVAADGTIYSAHNFNEFFSADDTGVDAFQIVHHKDGNITFRIVANKRYTTDSMHHIVQYWHKELNLPVDVAVVDRLPIHHNNKRLVIVNE